MVVGVAPNEHQLSQVLSEFARTLVTDFPIQGILDHLVKRIVDVLPISAAGVTLIAPDRAPRYVAASDESALRYEELQSELGEGPCLAAYRTGRSVAVPDLNTDPRFPSFAARALEEGLVAVFTFPLHNGDTRLGALDLYRDQPGPLNAEAMVAAQTLADVAAAYLLNAQARDDLRESSDHALDRALHDPLTGLPNRSLLLERLDHAVLRGRRSGKLAAVLFADLDRFKEVNDLHGHAAGDELLVAVAQRLTLALRPGDTLARMSGDEFVILCEDLTDPAEVDAIASRVVTVIAEPFRISGVEVAVTASVGIAFSGRGDALSEQLLRDADAAMYQAKRGGGARHQLMDLRERFRDAQRASLEQDLRGATTRGELHLEYEPIVATADQRIIGGEALLRWDHPSRGSVDPRTFLPIAEQTLFITDIGPWVLENACRDHLGWRELAGSPELQVSINVSGHQLLHPGFANTVAGVLSIGPTEPGLVILELTEKTLARDPDRALDVLGELKTLGVVVALDGFGVGDSPLGTLQRFPIDVVKLDHGLIAELDRDRPSHAIVVATVGLAHGLGMTVIAGGVETAAQLEHLAAIGCDASQGSYLAGPMTSDDLSAMIRQPLLVGSSPAFPRAPAVR